MEHESHTSVPTPFIWGDQALATDTGAASIHATLAGGSLGTDTGEVGHPLTVHQHIPAVTLLCQALLLASGHSREHG